MVLHLYINALNTNYNKILKSLRLRNATLNIEQLVIYHRLEIKSTWKREKKSFYKNIITLQKSQERSHYNTNIFFFLVLFLKGVRCYSTGGSCPRDRRGSLGVIGNNYTAHTSTGLDRRSN